MKILQYKFYNLLAILFLVVFASCERELVADITGTTPPSLQVTVKNATAQPVTGATVQLYNTEEAWTTETGPLTTKQTNDGGMVVFEKEELKDPGFFYLIATEGANKIKLKTKYLLLTDGKTIVDIKFP